MSKRRKEQVMSFADAVDLAADIDNDLPDGAFWALAHDIAGLDYGDGFDELSREDEHPHKCATCGRRFRTPEAMRQHARDKHKGATP